MSEAYRAESLGGAWIAALGGGVAVRSMGRASLLGFEDSQSRGLDRRGR